MANTMYRGEDKIIAFTIKTSAGLIANLTAATATFRMSASYTVAPPITKVGAIPAPATGVVNVFFTEVETAAIAAGHYIFELEITQDGATSIASTGTIQVLSSLIEAP